MLTDGVVANASWSGLDKELLGGSRQDPSLPTPGGSSTFRCGFRSNGTMAGKGRWSMFVSCLKDSPFTPIALLQRCESQVENFPCFREHTAQGVHGGNVVCQARAIRRCYLETRTKFVPMVFTMKILLWTVRERDHALQPCRAEFDGTRERPTSSVMFHDRGWCSDHMRGCGVNRGSWSHVLDERNCCPRPPTAGAVKLYFPAGAGAAIPGGGAAELTAGTGEL